MVPTCPTRCSLSEPNECNCLVFWRIPRAGRALWLMFHVFPFELCAPPHMYTFAPKQIGKTKSQLETIWEDGPAQGSDRTRRITNRQRAVVGALQHPANDPLGESCSSEGLDEFCEEESVPDESLRSLSLLDYTHQTCPARHPAGLVRRTGSTTVGDERKATRRHWERTPMSHARSFAQNKSKASPYAGRASAEYVHCIRWVLAIYCWV